MIEELASKKEIISIQTHLVYKIVKSLIDQGFFWITPVVTTKCTDPLWPDPNFGIEGQILFEIYGEKAVLMQSMIIHKRILVSSGYDKIFVISPNIRLEKKERISTGRHAYEFIQIDFEIKEGKMEDVLKLVEKLLYSSIKYVSKKCKNEFKMLGVSPPKIKIPFKVYDREELEKEFGKDWEERISYESKQPFWVINIPRYFYDFEDFKTGKWKNYDLILPNGYGEVLSGGEREYEYEKIVFKMERDNISKEKYTLLLDLAKKKKLVPSAGGGIGLERLVRWVTSRKTVYDVQLFVRKPGFVGGL
ncbi:MAG: asparagine synthetase A [Candidatus Aenigmatarchaeota archaeon]